MTSIFAKEVRKFIYDHFFKFSYPPTLEQMLEKFKKNSLVVFPTLLSLHQDHMIVFDQKINKIMIAHPFAGIPTSFIVKNKSNKRYFATCAWDSVAMHIAVYAGSNNR